MRIWSLCSFNDIVNTILGNFHGNITKNVERTRTILLSKDQRLQTTNVAVCTSPFFLRVQGPGAGSNYLLFSRSGCLRLVISLVLKVKSCDNIIEVGVNNH